MNGNPPYQSMVTIVRQTKNFTHLRGIYRSCRCTTIFRSRIRRSLSGEGFGQVGYAISTEGSPVGDLNRGLHSVWR